MPEIDEGTDYIGYKDALELICLNANPVGVEEVATDSAVNRIVSEDIIALLNNPSSDVSVKDGFAVKSEDIAEASFEKPVCLPVIGSVFAGGQFEGVLAKGKAVKICSGSPMPKGADSVVSEEFCEETPSGVKIVADSERGRNILRKGEDIKAGNIIIEKGKVLLPGYLGLLAAAGIQKVKVYRRPNVAVIAIGDEVVAPGQGLHPGQLYASNLVTMCAWLESYGTTYKTAVVGDNKSTIRQELLKHLPEADSLITSGGAWGSERDLVVGVLDKLGWRKFFHRVRMGPGKGIAFGLLEDKPVFCLPGGPASNEMAFIQLALPGILRMGGRTYHPLQTVSARLTRDMTGRHLAWTEFKDAMLSCEPDGSYVVSPYRPKSRLLAIASANCLLCIPEGADSLCEGDTVNVQILRPRIADIC
jgi:molybdopterin molybdotransferase